MSSRVLLSSSSGCRGVARLKMGSIALTRQNKRSESGDNNRIPSDFSRTFWFNNYDSKFNLSGVQNYHSSSSTNSFDPAGMVTCCMQELECSAPPLEGSWHHHTCRGFSVQPDRLSVSTKINAQLINKHFLMSILFTLNINCTCRLTM